MIRAFPAVLGRSSRLVPWWHLAFGLVAAFGLAATRRTTYLDDVVFGLRVGAVALVASTAFVFDDPALNLMDGKPVPLWLQRSARLTLVLPAIVAGWWLLLAWMEAGLHSSAETAGLTVPRLALSIEVTALLGIVWAAATLMLRAGRETGGMVAATALLAIVVGLILLPERWTWFASPAAPPVPGEGSSPQWQAWVDAHRRWAALAVAGWAAVVVGVRGPASSRRVRWPRPALNQSERE